VSGDVTVLTPLPPRKEFIIRDVHAITMDPVLGDVADANIHVRDGTIVNVSAGPPIAEIPSISGGGGVALPGFIDTHTHLWSGLFRSLVSDGGPLGYNPLKRRLGPAFRPEDTYAATVLGLVEALDGGVTTVNNWAHNVRTADDADASLRAHQEVGIRGRFSYGSYEGIPESEVMNLADAARVRAHLGCEHGGLVDLGLAFRGPALTPESVYREEWESARSLALPATIHYASYRHEVERVRVLEVLDDADLLDVRLQLVHALYCSRADRAMISSAGMCVSCAPLASMRHGLGFTPLRELRQDGVEVSLSLDSAGLAGSLDMFSLMRVLLMAEHARHEDDGVLSARDVLRMATVGGAIDLGLTGVGTLAPGNRADIIVVDVGGLHSGPISARRNGDVANQLVYAGHPSNVRSVVVDGRVLKADGVLVNADAEAVVVEAASALDRVLERAGLRGS